MLLKIILVLTVFMSAGFWDIIPATTVRDIDVPKLNLTRIVGKWHLLTAYESPTNNRTSCMSFDINKLSNDSFTMERTLSLRKNADENPNAVSSDDLPRVLRGEIQNNSGTVMMSVDDRNTFAMVIFDVDYSSHIAIFMTNTEEEMSDGSTGTVFIFVRGKSLPDSVIERIKQSNFYQQGMDSRDKSKLRILNITDCPQLMFIDMLS